MSEDKYIVVSEAPNEIPHSFGNTWQVELDPTDYNKAKRVAITKQELERNSRKKFYVAEVLFNE